MDLSVVVPTLNSRDQLASCLDALAAADPTECLVVNGPSADGTSGMCRDRDDVDVLVEIDARNVNVARNAGIRYARGETVAFISHDLTVDDGWTDAVEAGLATGAVATGPVRASDEQAADGPESRSIGGRSVTYLAGGNVAFARDVLTELDGFDESLDVGGARDIAHRLAGIDEPVSWEPSMTTLVKNYGVRPTVAYRVARHAVADGVDAARDVLRGDGTPSRWAGNGRDVLAGTLDGLASGFRARFGDRSPRRNPSGLSARADRAVAVYDRRG
ncbi:glycosyl transferase family 2 [Halobacteriales archaeon SW_6_65_46]|nr:MAG: glycosyl transferase family 2 [Halobacteriales archaeon SW_6_65_46]